MFFLEGGLVTICFLGCCSLVFHFRFTAQSCLKDLKGFEFEASQGEYSNKTDLHVFTQIGQNAVWVYA